MNILIALISLSLSALFSGSEIAFLTANKLKVELERKKGSKKSRIISRFYDFPSQFLSTLLVGNNVVLVIFTYIMSGLIQPQIARVVHQDLVSLLITTLILTLIVLIFGEYLPKTTFRIFADRALQVFAYPLRFFQILFLLPTWFMTKISDFLLHRVFSLPITQVENALTRVDLEYFVKSSSSSSEESIESELFENALYLQEVKVKACLIPRTEIVYLDRNASIDDLIDLFQETKLSRILVIDHDLDEVKGYVHHQRLLGKYKSITAMTMPIMTVPETLKVQDLLNKFISRKQSIACVVDEFGATAGIITMEDILEELFGEIDDEHDAPEYVEEILGEKEYRFSGRLEIDYLNEKYDDINLPEGDYHTLSGFIVMTYESIPDEGEKLTLSGYEFLLEEVSDKKIEVVHVKLIDDNLDD